MRRFRRLADVFDTAWRVPGTRLRFGADALVGLVPVAGDVAGAAFGLYGVWTAWRVGAPPAVLARMVANVALDLLLGLVPGVGDVADFLFPAHTRNRRLLEGWLARPGHVARRSRTVVVGVPAAAGVLLVGALAGAFWLLAQFVRWLGAAWAGA
ncbi:MAG: DUF4112 domain-containing protein [bacterium]|nr:DUF4112 domain-containing protein [bacterium]